MPSNGQQSFLHKLSKMQVHRQKSVNALQRATVISTLPLKICWFYAASQPHFPRYFSEYFDNSRFSAKILAVYNLFIFSPRILKMDILIGARVSFKIRIASVQNAASFFWMPQGSVVNQSSHPTIRTDPSAQNQVHRPRSPRKIHSNILLTGMLHLHNPLIKVLLYNSIFALKIQWCS